MYKIFNGKSWIEFSRYEYLINWVAQFNSNTRGEFTNSFLNRVGTNQNDVYFAGRVWSGRTSAKYLARDYRVVNANGNSIYSKAFVDDVKNWIYSEEIMKKWDHEMHKLEKRHYYNWYGNIPESAYPEFRRGPWPYIHKHWAYKCFRCIKTTNEMKQTSDKEMRDFTRGSRGKNLPSSWDDIFRGRDNGWKSQRKNKHQWENKVKLQIKHSYGKGVYVEQGKDTIRIPEWKGLAS